LSYTHLEVNSADHITRIVLNRPAVMNAINQEMHDDLQLAFDEFSADADQYLCVISGAGERAFFCGE
jgi:enoyl-CoA hydratase/carnithine racemase